LFSTEDTMTDTLERAEDFLHRNGRLLERRLFAAAFRGAPPDGVVEALGPYQNPNGGFGWGLEPDKRTPASQPIDLQVALETLAAVGAVPRAMLNAAAAWFAANVTEDGGLPNGLPSANAYPHAPWWAAGDADLKANLNPTAADVGLFLSLKVAHPALERAAAFCWGQLDATTSGEFHEIMPIVIFLEHASDRARAAAALERVAGRVGAPGVVELDPDAGGYVHKPLEFAPSPVAPLRRLFEQAVIDRHLDALAARQLDDGGWPLNWETVGPGAALEARGMVTLNALRTLRAYGRL
jgi:hypothetical protein